MTGKRLSGLIAASMLLLSIAGLALGGNARETRKQAESSLLVTGSIIIGEDGKVLSHEVDPKIGLTPELAALVGNAATHWKFEPVLTGTSYAPRCR